VPYYFAYYPENIEEKRAERPNGNRYHKKQGLALHF
jgi:hypothetical protein